MKSLIENCICLEVTTNTKGYSSLHVYEVGKGSYGFHSLNVKSEKLPDVNNLVGKRANIEISLFEGNGTNGKYVSKNFEGNVSTK